MMIPVHDNYLRIVTISTHFYSYSIVAGGLGVTSNTTRATLGMVEVIRDSIS